MWLNSKTLMIFIITDIQSCSFKYLIVTLMIGTDNDCAKFSVFTSRNSHHFQYTDGSSHEICFNSNFNQWQTQQQCLAKLEFIAFLKWFWRILFANTLWSRIIFHFRSENIYKWLDILQTDYTSMVLIYICFIKNTWPQDSAIQISKTGLRSRWRPHIQHPLREALLIGTWTTVTDGQLEYCIHI